MTPKEAGSIRFHILDDLLTTNCFSELGRRTGLSRVHVSNVLRGKAGYSDSMLRLISNNTGFGMDALVGFIEDQRLKRKAELDMKELKRCKVRMKGVRERVEVLEEKVGGE